MIGKLLGDRYEIIEKIGGGGMALVYKARCRLLNRYVAVKVLRYELIEDQEFVKRFNVEAQAAASLSHPNIVSVYDVGQQGDIHYIVMEYIDGMTLKEYITQEGVIPWKEALNIAMQICSALEHAHKKRIVHRDIKPHNIMITENGMVKVTDFGIARAVSSCTVTIGDNTLGSVHYFSPEQARGGYTDEKSDIYSLGIVMYEMLTGKVPFEGESPVSVAIKHIQDTPDLPRNINKDIPEVIQSIILKAISKEQNNRYASATEMLGDIYRAFRTPDEDFVERESFTDSPTRKVPVIKSINGSDKMKSNRSKKKLRKEDKIAIIAAIITSIVVISGISYAGYKVFNGIFAASGPEEVPMPNFIGKDYETVKDLYTDYEVIKVQEVYSDEYEKGKIVSQDPDANDMVKLPTRVEVEVSKGVKLISIPDLTNIDYRNAEIQLENLQLRYIIKHENHDRVPDGFVIRHIPGPQQSVKEGELVQLFVSTGPEIKMVKVPNLVGKTEEEAKEIIRRLGLVQGEIKRDNSDQPENTVIRQSLEAGNEVEEKTVIDLVVSKGKMVEKLGQTITLLLPQDKEQMEVKVISYSAGVSKLIYKKVHNKNDSPLEIKVTGEGDVFIQAYVDGTLVGEQTIHFGGEDE